MYLLPPILLIDDGPHRPMWINSSGLMIFVFMIEEWLFLLCFPISQATHKWSLSNLRSERPRTRSPRISLLISLKFNYESLRCQSQLSSDDAFVTKEIDGFPSIAFISSGYIYPFLLDLKRTFLTPRAQSHILIHQMIFSTSTYNQLRNTYLIVL